MEQFIGYLKDYGVFVALPLVVAGLTQAVKTCFKKFFLSQAGARLINFVPIFLGMVGGLFLPVEGYGTRVMIGGALGQLSSLIYTTITRTFGSVETVNKIIDRNRTDIKKKDTADVQ